MVALSRGFYINIISLVTQIVAAGLTDEVVALTKIVSMRWYRKYVGVSRPGHCNELALIMKRPLSEALLYLYVVLYSS